MPEEEAEEKIEFTGRDLRRRRAVSASTLADLDAGEYAMVCFIPVGARRSRTARRTSSRG